MNIKKGVNYKCLIKISDDRVGLRSQRVTISPELCGSDKNLWVT